MKKFLIKICIIFALSVLTGCAAFAPMATGNITDNIYVVENSENMNFSSTNLFIIRDSTQYVVIDAGTSLTETANEMEKLGINPNSVAAVFLTHTDWDHVGALELFGNAQLFMSKEEEQLINGQRRRAPFMRNSIPRTDYNLLTDREIVQVGNLTIKGFLTPGHTPGSMVFLVNNRYLFTGDALRLRNGEITGAQRPRLFNMNTRRANRSVNEIIRQIPAKYIFTSHFGYLEIK